MDRAFLGIKKPRLTCGAWGPAVPAGLLLFPLRPGADEAAVQRRGVPGGDALGVVQGCFWPRRPAEGSDLGVPHTLVLGEARKMRKRAQEGTSAGIGEARHRMGKWTIRHRD